MAATPSHVILEINYIYFKFLYRLLCYIGILIVMLNAFLSNISLFHMSNNFWLCSFLNLKFSTSLSVNVISCLLQFVSGRIVRNIAWCYVPRLVFQESRLPFLLKCFTWHCFVLPIRAHTFSAFTWGMERSYLLASLSAIPGLPPNPGKWNFCGGPLFNSFWTIVSYFNPISFFLFQTSRIFSHTLFC